MSDDTGKFISALIMAIAFFFIGLAVGMSTGCSPWPRVRTDGAACSGGWVRDSDGGVVCE